MYKCCHTNKLLIKIHCNKSTGPKTSTAFLCNWFYVLSRLHFNYYKTFSNVPEFKKTQKVKKDAAAKKRMSKESKKIEEEANVDEPEEDEQENEEGEWCT